MSLLLRSVNILSNSYKILPASNARFVPINSVIINKYAPLLEFVRQVGFFSRVPASQLWKGVSSVSNAGKKRGRGKSVMRPRDLNRGQIIGVGKENIIWPGLNAPIIQGKELVHQQRLPPNPNHESKILEIRDNAPQGNRMKIDALDRGWSGKRLPGRSIGPPDPIGEDNFEGFDTKVIEHKQVFTMKGNMGRKRRWSVFVVTGNKNGLAGFAQGKSNDPRAAMRKAKNRAGQHLIHFELYNGHTIIHDFFAQFSKTKIFAKRMHEGYGLVCHRAIKVCCELLGIKDLHAKVEGSTCVHHVVKAFFIGILQQKNLQQLAEEKGLLVVENRKTDGSLPKVVARPSRCRKEEEIDIDEVTDFKLYAMNNRVPLKRKKHPPFYTRLPYWPIYLKKQETIRNKDKVRLNMLVEHGELRSFLTDNYPECKPGRPKRKPEEAEA
ncbi:small ribosomal subunit protein uS5m [Culicoides brevitarsis]|uniref:small ribosomal subunit protein uS5m n=1 Tax=Culicoides brevitarsis TaxID=469753 RepID=UPI00307B62BA